jgi:hypothetical protein
MIEHPPLSRNECIDAETQLPLGLPKAVPSICRFKEEAFPRQGKKAGPATLKAWCG